MKKLLAVLLLLPSFAYASEVKELSLMPSDVFGLFSALNAIGTKERICKDGANEKPCTEQVKVPPGLSLVVALDLRALKAAIEDYQYAQHKIVAAVTGGSGYLEPRSKQEAEANFQVADLARIPIKVSLSTLSAKELDDAKIDISPVTRAALLPILEDTR